MPNRIHNSGNRSHHDHHDYRVAMLFVSYGPVKLYRWCWSVPMTVKPCNGKGWVARVLWGLGRQVLVGARSAPLLLRPLVIHCTRSPTVEAATRFSVRRNFGIWETPSVTLRRYLLDLCGTMMKLTMLPLVVELVHWTFRK